VAARVRWPEDRPGEAAEELERENERLKKAGSELTLDKQILKEALSG
jgi:hypothetical protein